MSKRHHVVILGGGFGGLHTARGLKRAPVDITLVDRRNFHLFQPLLYQVATGGLSPANISAPLRGIFKRQRNVRVLLDEAVGLDAENRRVELENGSLSYDTLVVATGARHHYLGNDGWEPLAPGLKTIEDATEIRRRILSVFEEAERENDPEVIRALLAFVVVGAGPTGVELAGALAEIARETLREDFRNIDPTSARIIIVEGRERVLPSYHPSLSEKAAHSLKKLGVEVRTDTLVTEILARSIRICIGDDCEDLATRTVLWAAGVQASAMGNQISRATGAQLDRFGRVVVEPDLSVLGRPEIFVLGDLAHFAHHNQEPLPGVAQVAMQQGDYAARLIRARLKGQDLTSFRYRDYGSMATVGRHAAVAELGPFRLSGYPAWLTWLFVHLMKMVEFQNRLLVFLQWAWNYFTFNRSARLITHPHGASAPSKELWRTDTSSKSSACPNSKLRRPD